MTWKAYQPTLLLTVDTALTGPAEHFTDNCDPRWHLFNEERVARIHNVTAGDDKMVNRIGFMDAAQSSGSSAAPGGLDGQRTG